MLVSTGERKQANTAKIAKMILLQSNKKTAFGFLKHVTRVTFVEGVL